MLTRLVLFLAIFSVVSLSLFTMRAEAAQNSLIRSEGAFFVVDSKVSGKEAAVRLDDELQSRGIPVFAVFDHAKNAQGVSLALPFTTVFVFGSPKVGTGLMQANPAIALELPLRIAIWEDSAGKTFIGFPNMAKTAEGYGLSQHPALGKIQPLLEELSLKAGARM